LAPFDLRVVICVFDEDRGKAASPERHQLSWVTSFFTPSAPVSHVLSLSYEAGHHGRFRKEIGVMQIMNMTKHKN
jgi:hypothetical protein